jgi:hypothetical protein
MLVVDLACADFAVLKYTPVVSCDVERSFSPYKAIFRENRQSFEFSNLRMHVVAACNPV